MRMRLAAATALLAALGARAAARGGFGALADLYDEREALAEAHDAYIGEEGHGFDGGAGWRHDAGEAEGEGEGFGDGTDDIPDPHAPRHKVLSRAVRLESSSGSTGSYQADRERPPLARPPAALDTAALPDAVVRLADTCWPFSDAEERYAFEVCPFRNVTQRSLRYGSASVLIGVWGRFTSPRKLLLDDGEECGGARREAYIVLECPDLTLPLEETHTRVLEIEQERFCNYRIRLRTAAACELDEEPAPQTAAHAAAAGAGDSLEVCHDALEELRAEVAEHFMEFVLPGVWPVFSRLMGIGKMRRRVAMASRARARQHKQEKAQEEREAREEAASAGATEIAEAAAAEPPLETAAPGPAA